MNSSTSIAAGLQLAMGPGIERRRVGEPAHLHSRGGAGRGAVAVAAGAGAGVQLEVEHRAARVHHVGQAHRRKVHVARPVHRRHRHNGAAPGCRHHILQVQRVKGKHTYLCKAGCKCVCSTGLQRM